MYVQYNKDTYIAAILNHRQMEGTVVQELHILRYVRTQPILGLLERTF